MFLTKFELPKDIDPSGEKSQRIMKEVNRAVANGKNGFDAIYQVATSTLNLMFEEQFDEIVPDIEYGEPLFIGL